MNAKRWLALSTALIMLSVSMAAFADTPTEMVDKAYDNGRLVTTRVSANLGSPFWRTQTLTIVADLLDALELQFSSQQSATTVSGNTSVLLNDEEVLFFSGMLSDDSDICISTSLLNGQQLYFTPQDLGGLALRFMDFMLTQATAMPQGEKDEAMASLLASIEFMLDPPPIVADDTPSPIVTFIPQLISSPKAVALAKK